MKQIILFLIATAILLSCSPKFRSTIKKKRAPLAQDEIVVVLNFEDGFDKDGTEIGVISADDNGFSVNCSYPEIIGRLKNLARQNGANLLKVIKHQIADKWSTCDRVTARLYVVDDPRKYEKEIEWTKGRKLIWEDFKGEVDPVGNLAAESHCTLGYQTNRITIFKKSKIFTMNIFNCNLSWVSPQQMNNMDLLEHEQGHFDLSEVYARQLRKKLMESNLTIFKSLNEADRIYREVYVSYFTRQDLYDQETNHGRNRKMQVEWNSKIANELQILEAFYVE